MRIFRNLKENQRAFANKLIDNQSRYNDKEYWRKSQEKQKLFSLDILVGMHEEKIKLKVWLVLVYVFVLNKLVNRYTLTR